MNRRDRARWRNTQTLDDLGELVIAWLNGEITETPGHGGSPCDETIPLIPVLTLVNRAGFVTDNSQLAKTYPGFADEAWVMGFMPGHRLYHLRKVVAEECPELAISACLDREHECGKRWPWDRCWADDPRYFWGDRCPKAADDMAALHYVLIGDPEPGRNDRLWPVLEKFAGGDR